MHFVAFLLFLTVAVVESSPFNCKDCGNVKCGENEVFMKGNAREDEFCKPIYTPLSVLKRLRHCVCKPHYVRNSWGECVPKKNCLRCKSRLQKDWHLCSASCPVTGNKAIRFFCRTMCTPGCDCPPGWVVDPNNWKKCIKAETIPPLCPPHSRFQPCVSTCEPVCGLRPPKQCFTHCHRGACVCNKGFAALVRNGELICVRQEKCEWYLRTAHFFALNRTATAGGENLANNLGSIISGPGSVGLPGTIGHAVSSERTYSVGTAPNNDTVRGPYGAALRFATTSSGDAIGLGSTHTGIGAAAVRSSGAVGYGGVGARLGSTMTSGSTRPGMSEVLLLGAPLSVSVGPGLGDGRVSVGSALSSVSMGSTTNHGGFPSASGRTGVNTARAVATNPVAAATTSLLPVRAPVTNVPVTHSGTPVIMSPADPNRNVHVDGTIAVNSGSATTPNLPSSILAAGLGAITTGIAPGSGSLPTRYHFSNTGAAGAHTGTDVVSVLHGARSSTGASVGLLPNAGVSHDTITMTTGAAVPVSGSHGGIGVGTGSAGTVILSGPTSSGTVLSGTSALSSIYARGIHADRENASGRSSVVMGRGIGNGGPRAGGPTSLVTSPTTENDRLVTGIGTTHGSLSSDSYRLASLSTLPDGIYSSTYATALKASLPGGLTGVAIGSGTTVSPPPVRVAPSEVGMGLNGMSRFYAGRVGDTIRINVGNGRLSDMGGVHSQALGTISTGVNGANVLSATSGSTLSTDGTASRGPDGVVSAPETPTSSIVSSGSNNLITGESGGARPGGASDISSLSRGHNSAGGVNAHSMNASPGVITEAGGSDGLNGADGRHTSASLRHVWTYNTTLRDGFNANGELMTPIVRNQPHVSTSTRTIERNARFLALPGATNSFGRIPFGGTNSTLSSHTTPTSGATGIFGTGATTEVASGGLSRIFTHPGNHASTHRGGAALPSSASTTAQSLGMHLSNVVPVGTVETISTALGARTEGAGAAGPRGIIEGHRMDIINPYIVAVGRTLSHVYPFDLSAVSRSGAAESSSGSLISGSSLILGLPQASVPSPNIDNGENLPNSASIMGGANAPVSGTTSLGSK